MIYSNIKLIGLVSIAFAMPAIAQKSVRLQGEYELGGALDHGGAILQGDSHLYISLSDDAARLLYQSLPGDPLDDPCTGYRAKSRGNVACYVITPERYFCSFSVDLEHNVVKAGLGGCF